jgi:hypothetical protein
MVSVPMIFAPESHGTTLGVAEPEGSDASIWTLDGELLVLYTKKTCIHRHNLRSRSRFHAISEATLVAPEPQYLERGYDRQKRVRPGGAGGIDLVHGGS